jgi:hypothetical protein
MLTVPPPSRAGSLPQGSRAHPNPRSHPKSNVGASLLAKAVCQAMKFLTVLTPSRAGSLPQGFRPYTKSRSHPKSNVGASLLAKALCQAMNMLTLPPPSRASPAPTGFSAVPKIPIKPPDNCRSRACSRKRCVRRWRGCLCRRLREQALLLQIFCRTQSPCTPKSNVGAGLLAKAICQTQLSINGGYRRRIYRHCRQSRPCAPPRNTHRPATSTTAPARFLRRPNHAPVGVRC